MTYRDDQIDQFRREFRRVTADLQALMLRGVTEAQRFQNNDIRKYITHGAGRRLGILKRSIENVFETFPPDRPDKLSRDELTSVEVHLHAFMINLSGVFDNWAWAFVHRHNLLEEIGDRRNIGIFRNRTQMLLPERLQLYLADNHISDWHEQYAKGYRDSLAHRIPIYVPPANWTDEDRENYERLEAEKARLIRACDWDQLDRVWDEQDGIGAPCFVFMHDYSADDDARPVYLHPQLLCDGLTVVDFGNRFYDSWDERSD